MSSSSCKRCKRPVLFPIDGACSNCARLCSWCGGQVGDNFRDGKEPCCERCRKLSGQPPRPVQRRPYVKGQFAALDAIGSKVILETLERRQWSIRLAAKDLGAKYGSFHQWLIKREPGALRKARETGLVQRGGKLADGRRHSPLTRMPPDQVFAAFVAHSYCLSWAARTIGVSKGSLSRYLAKRFPSEMQEARRNGLIRQGLNTRYRQLERAA